MKHRILAAVLLAGLTTPLLPAAPAEAQGRACGERSRIIEHLRSAFGEVPTGAGLSANNGIVEIFASAETGTWTILLTMPTGESCLMAAGEGWEQIPEAEAAAAGQPV